MRKPSFFSQIAIGAALATVVIGCTSLWVTIGARSTAAEAASKVSKFYLREFAGRRMEMVSAAIADEFDYMRRALEIVGPENLASQDAVREFLAMVETAYGTDKFALVDQDDIVYTRYTTYSGGSRYDFLSNGDLESDEVISATNLYGARKQVCLAIPVEGLKLMGKDIKACFVQVNIDQIVQGLALDSEDNTTFFGLYHENGDNLTDLDFGPFAATENLINSLRGDLDKDTWLALSADYSSGGDGSIEFSHEGKQQTLYYLSVPETNWVLAVLVADDLIQEQVYGVGNEMIVRSWVLIGVTGSVLLVYFGAIIFRTRRDSEVQLEEERRNTRVAGERAQRSERELGQVRKIAYMDTLTGVGSNLAYAEEEIAIDEAIRAGSMSDLAVVVCDVNGLKHVNDTYGHAAGDEYIRAACKLICDMFAHSNVYRIGGDEFVVIVRGDDFEHRNELLAELDRRSVENITQDGAVVSAGMADFVASDEQLHVVVRRADERMYARKAELKVLGARVRD
jgi:diguanylate cyclase (GGDEF)-like protein